MDLEVLSPPVMAETLAPELEEEDLVAILCLLDVANDFCLLIRFLLWLLPKASISNVVSPGQNYRFSTSPALLGKEFACMISESIILTSLRRCAVMFCPI